MKTHTPGPWFVRRSDADNVHVGQCDTERWIARIYEDAENYYENALLISAAPDLFGVCLQLINELTNQKNKTEDQEWLIKIANQVIEKARGEK